MVKYCAVRSCHTKSDATIAKFENQTISFHYLPSNGNIAQKWLSALGSPRYPDNSSPAAYQHARVCSKYFQCSDFNKMSGTSQSTSRRRLKKEKPEAEEEEEIVTKRYEEELEINDFPQTCRWKVTSKDTLLQICEYSEAGVTIRGQYFPPGKQPGEDERKLYLAIEAVQELAVQKAKNEITRLIKEELIRLQNSYQPINKGRYKVL